MTGVVDANSDGLLFVEQTSCSSYRYIAVVHFIPKHSFIPATEHFLEMTRCKFHHKIHPSTYCKIHPLLSTEDTAWEK